MLPCLHEFLKEPDYDATIAPFVPVGDGICRGILVAVCRIAVADDQKGEASISANNRSSSHRLPGRIYVAVSRTPCDEGTKYEMVSFDPNVGDWRYEPIPPGYAQCLRISPSGKTAAYWRSGLRDEAFAYPLHGSSKEISLLSEYGGCSLTWAPDGKRLLVTTCGYKSVNSQGVLRMQAWLVNADGSAKYDCRFPIPTKSGLGRRWGVSLDVRATAHAATAEQFQVSGALSTSCGSMVPAFSE